MAIKDLSLSERIRACGRQCAHPYIYYRNGERKVSSCGKCPACLAQKANARTKVLQQEYSGHKYNLFVTLTYNNDNVPLLYAEKRDCHYELFDVTKDGEIGQIVASSNIGDKALQKLKEKCNLNGFIPYLRYKDVQLFLKRLRKHLNKYTHETLRYFAVGEYGPLHFRPHFHLLLFFDSSEIFAHIREAIPTCWKNGNVDVQLPKKQQDSCRYLTSYLNSYLYLPNLLKARNISPQIRHSTHLGEHVYQKLRESFLENDYRQFTQISLQNGADTTTMRVWRSLQDYFYPKCYRYSEVSYDVALRIYNVYNELLTFCRRNGFNSQVVSNNVNFLYNNYGKIKESEVYKLFPWLRDTPYRDQYFEVLPQKDQYLQRCYLSRRVLNTCATNGITLRSWLNNVRGYYDYMDAFNLYNQLVLEEKIQEPITQLALFDNLFTNEIVMYGGIAWDSSFIINEHFKSDFFVATKNMYNSMIESSIKHRKQNAQNIEYIS